MPSSFGLSAALAIPFREDGEIALDALADHAAWCLDRGCGSVSPFGTTGEGVSLSFSERDRVLGALAGKGIVPERSIVGGVAATSIKTAADQLRQIAGFGCRAALVVPPFYYKGLDEEGLYRWFSGLLECAGSPKTGVILYHIPGVTQVPLSERLIARLREAFPELIAGVKDSGGDFDHTRSLLAAHGDLAILVGDERYLAEGMRRGAQGSISGLANICPAIVASMIANGEDDPRVADLVDAVLENPVTPAVKTLIAHRSSDAGWLRVRPPLSPIPASAAADLAATFDKLFNRVTGEKPPDPARSHSEASQ